MSDWIPVLKVEDIGDGVMKTVSAKGQELLIVQVGNTFFAVDNRCPHRGGNLSQGKLSGTIVTCPLHGSQFDLRNGQVVRWVNLSGPSAAILKVIKPPRPIKTYPVKSDAGQILVEI